MLPRRHRFPLRHHPEIFAQGHREVTAEFVVYWSADLGSFPGASPDFQAAVVVPKAVAASSVARHALKRRLMTLLLPLSTMSTGSWVFIARSKAANLDYLALVTAVETAMTRVKAQTAPLLKNY